MQTFKNDKILVMKTIKLSAIAVALLAFTACQEAGQKTEDPSEVAENSNEAKMDNSDSLKNADYMVSAASGNLAEVELAKTATTKSKDSEIKKIAADLVTAHQGLYGEVKSLATSKGVTVPESADEDASKKAKDLLDTKAADFDKKWVDELIDKHEATVKKYEDVAANTSDADLRAWVTATIPKVKDHLMMLQAKKDKMK
jgi:putative membrane protein